MMGGGIKSPSTGEKTFWNDLWLYDTTLQEWIQLETLNTAEGTEMPMVRWCHTLMAGADGTFYIHGRSSNQGFDNDYWQYTHDTCAPSCGAASGHCFLGTCACPAGCQHTFVARASGCECPTATSAAASAVGAAVLSLLTF